MDYELILSERKSISLQLRDDGSLLVRAPGKMKRQEIDDFVQSKAEWVAAKRAVMAQGSAAYGGAVLTAAELARLKEAAETDLGARLRRWAQKIGVQPCSFGIRAQHTRWGSCSGRGHISLNALLMLAPETVRDYVVVHELCHLREPNHSPRFWHELERALPEYRAAAAWLKQNGSALMRRNPKNPGA